MALAREKSIKPVLGLKGLREVVLKEIIIFLSKLLNCSVSNSKSEIFICPSLHCPSLPVLLSGYMYVYTSVSCHFVGWSKKWNDLVNKGPEYGSLKRSWVNITNEADQLAEIHNELQIRLVNQVHGSLQKWKSSNYHKSLLSWKETKSAEEGFSKAQKPWARRHDEGNFFYLNGR